MNFKQTFYQQNIHDGTSEKGKTRLKKFNAFARGGVVKEVVSTRIANQGKCIITHVITGVKQYSNL